MDRPAAVKVLIDMKANVNRADDAGRYPLHLAAANGALLRLYIYV
jgi:ankyrin repeat protein